MALQRVRGLVMPTRLSLAGAAVVAAIGLAPSPRARRRARQRFAGRARRVRAVPTAERHAARAGGGRGAGRGDAPTGDVPRCFGRASFARTVWYRVPELPVAQEITVEATGRTLDPIDLAAFVQPAPAATGAGPPPALARPLRSPTSARAIEDGGARRAEEPASAVDAASPRQPSAADPGRPPRARSVRRRRARAALARRRADRAGSCQPLGDRADGSTPSASGKRTDARRPRAGDHDRRGSGPAARAPASARSGAACPRAAAASA